jgi:hypothetical protein
MKLLLKAFLILLILSACIYAAAPLWLPYILARQLPPGWQLETLDSSYPGPAGIDVNLLRVKNETGVIGIAINASDLRFNYRELDTDIGLVSLDIYLPAAATGTAEPFTLDKLSLPVIRLAGNLPRLSAGQIRVAIHRLTGIRPLLMEFDAFELTPHTDQGFRLASRVTIVDSLRFAGNLEIDSRPDLISAIIRFPSNTDPLPWLTLEARQAHLPAQTTTEVKAVLNADLANREWLDSILASTTRQVLTQLGGRLEIEAGFTGQDKQDIEQLSVASENLSLLTRSGTLDFGVNILASREGGNIAVKLQSPLSILFKGETAWFDAFPGKILPGLQLSPLPAAVISAELGRGGKFLISEGSQPALSFTGDVYLDLDSDPAHLVLQSTGLQVGTGNINNPESTSVEGLVSLNWEANAPVTYSTEDNELSADALSMTATLTSRNGKLVSSGSATLLQATMKDPAIATEKVETTWEDLDLTDLTGKLGVRTYGFVTELNDETWTGFDIDITHALLGKTEAGGNGTLLVANGPAIPFEFSSNLQNLHSTIKLPPTSFKLTGLRKLLSVAHVNLPKPLKLTGGYIELQGDILVGDEITAKMLASGHEMAASIGESNVRNAGFTFNMGYNGTPWANGPVSIEKLELAGGIGMANIRSEFTLANVEQFGLKDFYAEVFDGQLEFGELRFVQNGIADTTAQLSHINFGKLLAYADIDGLDGTGYLDIALPVGSDETGIHVKNGTFGSIAPGRLTYTREGLAGSNIGLQALENFQFKDLSGTFNYQSDGAYLIGVRLDGKNPDLYNGHPLVFNLNINGSLPALFEAMFLTGSFEESILNEIKSR